MLSILILALAFGTAAVLKLTKTGYQAAYTFILRTHLFLLPSCLLVCLLLMHHYSLRGIYTDKLILILLAASGMLLFGLYRGKRKLLRAYFAAYFLLPFSLLFGLIIPPLQFITAIVGIGLLLDGEYHRYPVDDTFFFQTKQIGLLAGPVYSLVEKKYLILEKATDHVIKAPGIAEKIIVKKLPPDSVRIVVVISELDGDRYDTTLSLKR